MSKTIIITVPAQEMPRWLNEIVFEIQEVPENDKKEIPSHQAEALKKGCEKMRYKK